MADSIDVFLRKEKMITGTQWSQSIEKHGFPVGIDGDFDPMTFTGLLPCKYRKRKTSFIFWQGTTDEVEWEDGPPCDFEDRDFSVNLEIRGGQYAYLVAAVSAAVLAHETNGIVVDADGETVIPGHEALKWAGEVVVDLEESIKKSENARKRVKALQKGGPASIRSALLDEVAKFSGSKPYRGMAYEETLYIHCDGPSGRRSLKIRGWVFSKDGVEVMTSEELLRLKREDEARYQSFVEEDLTNFAEDEIASMALNEGDVLVINFVNGYSFTIDPSWERGLGICSQWEVKVAGVEFWCWNPHEISIHYF